VVMAHRVVMGGGGVVDPPFRVRHSVDTVRWVHIWRYRGVSHSALRRGSSGNITGSSTMEVGSRPPNGGGVVELSILPGDGRGVAST